MCLSPASKVDRALLGHNARAGLLLAAIPSLFTQSKSIMKYASLSSFLDHVKRRNATEPEFIQAVCEVAGSVWPYITAHPRYSEQGLLDRLIEPERVIQFRVSWVDDTGATRVNRAWRVQHSSSLGPYKGGMRFHPEVTPSVLKFLAFEQTFKNALTTLPMGGGKGGSDFDPKGRSSSEVMRFCQALTMGLFRHIGADIDVPAGDIGVGQREVGYMAGMMKKLTNNASAAFTGKSIVHGGSFMRPEATGYGTVYFTQEMLALRKLSIEGTRAACPKNVLQPDRLKIDIRSASALPEKVKSCCAAKSGRQSTVERSAGYLERCRLPSRSAGISSHSSGMPSHFACQSTVSALYVPSAAAYKLGRFDPKPSPSIRAGSDSPDQSDRRMGSINTWSELLTFGLMPHAAPRGRSCCFEADQLPDGVEDYSVRLGQHF